MPSTSTELAQSLDLGGSNGVELFKSMATIEHDQHDKLIQTLLNAGCGRCQRFIRRAIISAAFTELFDGNVEMLRVKNYPIKAGAASVVITDKKGTVDTADDEVVLNTTYRVRNQSGMIERTTVIGGSKWWPRGVQRFEVVYTGGLEDDADWEDVIQEDLRMSVIDLVRDMYENPDPRVEADAVGAGMMKRLTKDAIPPRIIDVWRRYEADL